MFELTRKLNRSKKWQITGTQSINGIKHIIKGGLLTTGCIKKSDAEEFLVHFIESKKNKTDKFNTKAIDAHNKLMNSSDAPTKDRKKMFEKNAALFGDIRLSEIDQDFIEDHLILKRYPKETDQGRIYRKYRGTNLNDIENLDEKVNVSSKYNTINTSVISPIRRLINFGATKRYCHKYAVKGLSQISQAEKPEYVYSVDEKNRCLQFNDHQITTLFIVIYYTGMRLIEALSLHWDKKNAKGLQQIDLENRVFNTYVSKTFIQRQIHMHEELYKWLSKINNRNEHEGRLFLWKNLQDKKNNTKPVLGLGNRWNMMTAFANVEDADKKKRHTLRHTFATHCKNNGADITDLMKTVGWKSLTSAKTYVHTDIKVSKRLIDSL